VETPTPMTPQEPSEFGIWFRRMRRLLALWRHDQFRRDQYGLFIRNVRHLLEVKLVLGSIILSLLTIWGIHAYQVGAVMGFHFLMGVVTLASLAGGSTLFSGDREQGTFELLWLSTGSEKSLIRMKLVSMMTALLFLVLPITVVVATYYGTEMSTPMAVFHLMVTAFFLMGTMILIDTWIPQAWAAFLVGVTITGLLYYGFYGSSTSLNPFMNFLMKFPPRNQGLSTGQIIFNRLLMISMALFFLRQAAGRLRQSG
jgi:hypothetical protein